MQTILDSNVLLDIIHGPSLHSGWSLRWLTELSLEDDVVTNAIVFSEASARFNTFAKAKQVLSDFELRYEPVPEEAAYEAGRAHRKYRAVGGTRERTLPDFLIGAHAFVSGRRILTRDGARFRAYFPDLAVIAPDSHP